MSSLARARKDYRDRLSRFRTTRRYRWSCRLLVASTLGWCLVNVAIILNAIASGTVVPPSELSMASYVAMLVAAWLILPFMVGVVGLLAIHAVGPYTRFPET